MFLPLIKTCPALGTSTPFNTFNKVDLPAPEPPIIPINFPLSSRILILRKPNFPPLNLYSIFFASNDIRAFELSAKKRPIISL